MLQTFKNKASSKNDCVSTVNTYVFTLAKYFYIPNPQLLFSVRKEVSFMEKGGGEPAMKLRTNWADGLYCVALSSLVYSLSSPRVP